MLSRSFLKGKLILLLVLLLFITITYFYVNSLEDNYENMNSDRCVSELTSIRYQLDVVTEYKNRLDKLLKETQKAHEADKERFKDIMESCIAMKQQNAICQSQFEDLQGECKKVREEYDSIRKKSDDTKKDR